MNRLVRYLSGLGKAALIARLCQLGVAILLPYSSHAALVTNTAGNAILATGFTSPYALSDFTLTNTNLNPADIIPADGTASLLSFDVLVLTGSNTGSGLLPGATTYLTTTAKGSGLVSFNWSYMSLDLPGFDVGGYLRSGIFIPLADASGQSGSVSFSVSAGEIFGFGVQTDDNTGEPGVLTISNFAAPADVVVPEPGTSALLAAALIALVFLHRVHSHVIVRGKRQ